MTPDFEYLMRLKAHGKFGHTSVGLLAFCVPVGLVAYYVFHEIVREPLTLLAPQSWRARLIDVPRPPAVFSARVHWVALSVLMGAVTHVVWDSLTHKGSSIVSSSPLLMTEVVRVADHSFRHYNVLQHASSIAGLLLIIWSVGSWYSRAPVNGEVRPVDGRRGVVVSGLVLLPMCFGVFLALSRTSGPVDFAAVRDLVVYSAIGWMAAQSIVLVGYGLLWRLGLVR
jgi:hypothetical protein